MIAILLSGGFFRSLQFTSVNTIAYAEIEPRMVSKATTLTAVAQQLALSTGVAVGALVVELTLWAKHESAMGVYDFSPAFLAVGALAASASLIFLRLAPDAGAELAGRKSATTATADERSST